MFEQFITRQAILRDNLALLGYELRFRGAEAARGDAESDPAQYRGVFLSDATTMVFHWETLVGKQLAFLPLGPRELIIGGALILPRNRAVIRIVTNDASTELAEICESLKAAGFRLCIDDWEGNPALRPLAPFADFVRIAMSEQAASPGAERAAHGAVPIALNVESWSDYKQARDLGFRLFQGKFFLKPQTFRRRTLSGTHRNSLRLLQAILSSPLNLNAVEQIVREEPAFTYKLLRYLNSPVMERAVEVRSIKNAIALLGEQEFRRWASIVAIATPASDKPAELLRIALTRAYFCEQLAFQLDRQASYDFFFTGLLSVMDAVLDQPLSEIVTELALPERVRGALNAEAGVLHEALQAARAYEEGDWKKIREAMSRLAFPELAVPACFQAANGRADELMHQESAG